MKSQITVRLMHAAHLLIQRKTCTLQCISSVWNTLIILEGKIKSKKAKGRPKQMWFDNIRQSSSSSQSQWAP